MPQVRKSYPNSSAHFFIAMKKLLLTFVALVCATVSYAQQQLVATLTHGDEITMFYGTYAYRDAMNAAVDGDVINLSGGNFQACTINKAVSIRGAGVNAEYPTYILGDCEINIPIYCTGHLTMEGLRFSSTLKLKGPLENAYFFKNLFSSVEVRTNSYISNAMFVNSQINKYYMYGSPTPVSCQFMNSLVKEVYVTDNSNLSANFINCVVMGKDGYSVQFCYSTFLNCILVNPSNLMFGTMPSTSSAFNCLAVSKTYPGNPFSGISAGQNNMVFQGFGIFIDGDYEKDLFDDFKASLLGTDGTPVGMYGGPLPFSFTPTYPQITKMNVASKTTPDGKLSVDIEVSAAQ